MLASFFFTKKSFSLYLNRFIECLEVWFVCCTHKRSRLCCAANRSVWRSFSAWTVLENSVASYLVLSELSLATSRLISNKWVGRSNEIYNNPLEMKRAWEILPYAWKCRLTSGIRNIIFKFELHHFDMIFSWKQIRS